MPQLTSNPEPARNKAIVEASFDAWRKGTGSPFDLLANDVSWTIVGHSAVAKTYPSREAFLREVVQPLEARLSEPMKPSVRRVYTDGDTVIALFDALGTAHDGKPYFNTYAWFLELRDGKIVRASAFFDSLALNDLWARVVPGSPASLVH